MSGRAGRPRAASSSTASPVTCHCVIASRPEAVQDRALCRMDLDEFRRNGRGQPEGWRGCVLRAAPAPVCALETTERLAVSALLLWACSASQSENRASASGRSRMPQTPEQTVTAADSAETYASRYGTSQVTSRSSLLFLAGKDRGNSKRQLRYSHVAGYELGVSKKNTR